MASKIAKSTILSKAMKNNTFQVRRVVSCAPTAENNTIGVINAAVTQCPFRTALDTVDSFLTRPNVNEDVTTLPPQSDITQTTIPYDNIPGPKGLPIVGTLFDYFKKDGPRFEKMFEAYQSRALDHGPIFKEKIGAISTVVISNPEAYNRVIQAEGKHPNRREMEPMAYYRQQKNIGLGLVNAQGEEWYKHRTVVSKKMLKMKEVLEYCQDMDRVADDFVSHIKSRTNPDGRLEGLEKELFKWAMESIGTFLFEDRIGCFANPTPYHTQSFIDNLQGFFKLMQPLMYNVPLYKITPTKLWKKYESYADNVLSIGRSFVEKKREQLNLSEPKEGDKVPFLEYLMTQQSLTDDEALSTAVDLLVGATETTSTGSTWVLYCLAKHPEVQEKLYNEIQNVLSEDPQITPAKLTQLPYIKAVLKETFRIYPITFATSRHIQSDLEILGYHLPEGTHVQANLYGMFRDPELFPNPEEFKPERWLRESNMDSNLKALSNLVWGHGARMCIGRRFAEQEMHIMLTKIVQNFRLEHDETVEPVLNTVMTPDQPLNLKFIPRNN